METRSVGAEVPAGFWIMAWRRVEGRARKRPEYTRRPFRMPRRATGRCRTRRSSGARHQRRQLGGEGRSRQNEIDTRLLRQEAQLLIDMGIEPDHRNPAERGILLQSPDRIERRA